jgi:hypothetical protein
MTVVAPRTLDRVTLQLGRVTSRGYRAVGQAVEAYRSRARRRWRATLPRRLREANVIDIVTVDSRGRRLAYHAYVSR